MDDRFTKIAYSDAGNYISQTVLHPLGLAAVLILGIATLLVRRRNALVPLMIMTCFVATAQRLSIGGLDFSLARIIILFGWLRLLLRRELRFPWRRMDTIIVIWAIVSNVAYVIERNFESWAVVFRLGLLFDTFGMYLLFRCLIRSRQDLERLMTAMAVMSIPCAAAFTLEHFTQRNIFSTFGGVPAETMVRDGRLRCQGAFSHPIIAGVFWAVLLPVIASLWWRGGRRAFLAAGGVLGCLVIILMCASSTPVIGVMLAMMGAAAYPFRYRIRAIRWTALLVLAGTHTIMMLTNNGPVWWLLAGANVVPGSTGHWRAILISSFVGDIKTWWAFGLRTTYHWGTSDLTNQYVVEGANGGILSLILFVITMAMCYQAVGRLWRSAETKSSAAFAWGLGVSLFVTMVCYLAISQFGQLIVVWYITVAGLTSLTENWKPSDVRPRIKPVPRGWMPGEPYPQRRRILRPAPASLQQLLH